MNISVTNPMYMKQLFRKKKEVGDELEETNLDNHGEEWVLLASVRVKFVLKPEPLLHVTLGQFGGFYKKPDKRSLTDFDILRQQLSENRGIMGQSEVLIVTNMVRYPNELKFLPKWILLKNGMIMQLRNSPAVILPTGRLDNLGLRILCEPFVDEEEIRDEQRQFADLPSIETLRQRLKQIYPSSSYEVIT